MKTMLLIALTAITLTGNAFAQTATITFQEGNKPSLNSIDVVKNTAKDTVSYVYKLNGNALRTLGPKAEYSLAEIAKISAAQPGKVTWDKTKRVATTVGGAIAGGALDVLYMYLGSRGQQTGGYFGRLTSARIYGAIAFIPALLIGGYGGYKLSQVLYFSVEDRAAISLLTSDTVINANSPIIMTNDSMDTIDALESALGK